MEDLPAAVDSPFRETLERLLQSYSHYYNIKRESSVPEFCAEAEFKLFDEQYFLVRSARLSESNSRELLFFAKVDVLDAKKAAELAVTAWEEGMRRVEPGPNHRCTDISLVIIAGETTPEVAAAVKKIKKTQSYKFGFQGYSHLRLAVYDLSKSTVMRNRMGDTLEKVISNIFTISRN